jgi:hypothetical protein
VAGSYTPGSLAAGKKGKKKKAKKTFGGFAGNWLDDVSDALVGVVTAPYYIARAGYHDLGYGDAQKGSELGAMGKGIWVGMRDYYKPLVKGDFSKFASNVYDHPFQLALDAATIATLGGAGIGKAGQAAAKASQVGSGSAKLGEKLAGLSRIDGAQYANLGKLQQAEALKGMGGTYLVPRQRAIVNSLGKVTAEVPVVRNPVVRGRKAVTSKILDKAGDKIPLTNGYFSPDRRGPRMAQAQLDRLERRNSERQVAAAAKALRALPKAAQVALYYRIPGFNTMDRYSELVASRRLDLEAKQNPVTKAGLKSAGARERLALEQDIRRLEDPEISRQILTPDEKTLAVERMLLDVEDVLQQHRARREAPGDRRGRAEQPLREIGIEPEAGERLGIISYAEKRVPKSVKKGASKRSMQAGKRVEDLASTGYAFRNALYKPDPGRILQSYVAELRHDRIGNNVAYAVSISDSYADALKADPESVARALKDGTLVRFTTEQGTIKKLDEIAEFVGREFEPIAKAAGNTEPELMVKLINEWVDTVKTSGSDGWVMPKQSWDELSAQVASAEGLMRKLLKTPTRLWRDLTLSLKGSFYVNNFLGNLLLGIVSYGAFSYTKELLKSGSKHSALGKKVDEAAPDNLRGQARVLAELSEQDMPHGGSKWNPLTAISVLGDKVANVGALFTEDNFRRAGLALEVRRAAKGLQDKRPGMQLADAMDEILNDADSVDTLFERVAGNMLDYTKLTPFEKNYLRTAYPFWSFMRSIAGRTIRLTLDEPWKIQVMRMFSEATLSENEDGMFRGIEDLPQYLVGLAQTGETKSGKTPVVSSYGANPFSSPADMAHQLTAMVSGEAAAETASPIAQMNPFVKSAVEALTGQDQFFGAPLQGSRAEIYATQVAKQFPQWAAYQKARYPNQNSVVKRTPAQVALQYMGVPVGTFDRGAYARQQAISNYYDNMERKSLLKRDAKRERSDRGVLLGLGAA